MPPTPERVAEQCVKARRLVLEMAYGAHKGHIGSALSIVELVAVGASQTRGLGTDDRSRDRLVLSKGHAATALYAMLAVTGLLSEDELQTYCHDDSYLATHPSTVLPGVDFATGSLGQGITFAVGAALASRLRGDDSRVFCILSDSELDEGSTWEAALIAAHLGLDNLVIAVDFNKQQGLGRTSDVLSLDGVPDAWTALGWHVVRCDGHDPALLLAAVDACRSARRPGLIVADTDSGHGVDFMERKVEWHYLPMSDEQYASATAQVGGESS